MMIFFLLPQFLNVIYVSIEAIMGLVWVPYQILWFSLAKI